MRALKFITGHMIYNLAYTKILQTITTKVANKTRRNEFELYDEKSKMERKKEAATISSIEDPHFTDPEEGTWVFIFVSFT